METTQHPATTPTTRANGLSVKAIKLLGYATYTGLSLEKIPLATYETLGIAKTDIMPLTEELVDHEMVDATNRIRTQKQLGALIHLKREHPEMATQIENAAYYTTRNDIGEYIWQLAESLKDNDIEGAKQIRKPISGIGREPMNMLDYLQELIDANPDYMELMDVEQGLTAWMRRKTERDELGEEAIAKATELAAKSGSADIRAYVDLYRYLATGERAKTKRTPTAWDIATEAIEKAYTGATEEAIERFEESLRMMPGGKNAFIDPIVNYVYGATLLIAHKNGLESKERVQRFAQDNNVRMDDEVAITRMICTYGMEPTTDDRALILIAKRLDTLLSQRDTAQRRQWCHMARLFFGIADTTYPEHINMAIVRHEMSHFESKKSTQIFRGTPLIGRLKEPHATKWVEALNSIAKLAQSSPSRTPKSQPLRLAYYTNGNELLNIVEHEMETDGTLGYGRIVSMTQLLQKGYDCMDATDCNIANEIAIRYRKGRQDVADILVANLKDTGRLFVGEYYAQHQPAVIEEEQARIKLENNGMHIGFRTNVGLDGHDMPLHHTVRYDGDHTFRIVTTNGIQRDMLEHLLSQETFPVSACAALTQTLHGIDGLFDIDTTEIDKLTGTTEQSRSRIAIRIIADEHKNYNISIRAEGARNGNLRMEPGHGDAMVIDNVEGASIVVVRNLQVETHRKDTLMEKIREEDWAEITSDTEATIYYTSSLLALLTHIHDHSEEYFAEWPKGHPLRFRGTATTSDINITINTGSEWFTIDGALKTELMPSELRLKDLLQKYSSVDKDGFVEIGEDEYIRMSEELRRHIETLQSLPQRKNANGIRVPKMQVGTLSKMLGELKSVSDSEFKAIESNMRQAFERPYPTPERLKAQLYDYQKHGYEWMRRMDEWGAGICLADDMGLGKTVQTIAFLLSKEEKGPSLVVAPKSVMPNWEAECNRFAPNMKVKVLNNSNERRETIERATAGDIVLCTYGLLVTESQALSSRKWNVVCLDEAHQIKNRTTQAAQSAMRLQSHSRVALTGTPLQNHLDEMWSLFQFLNPGMMGTWNDFQIRFIKPQGITAKHTEILRDTTQPFILRRTKENVLADLPEKIVSEYRVEMSEAESEVYEEMRKLAEMKFKKHKTKAEKDEARRLKMNFFDELTKLRLAACAMQLVHNTWTEKSSKLSALMDILRNIGSNPANKIIIFSQFTSFLSMVRKELERENMAYLYLDGQTPVEKRSDMVEQFQAGKYPIFVSSLKAGGLGINLTAANYVIILDPWWNPAIENQAMDRAHRMGQKRCVQVIRMITSNSIEEKILKLHKKKSDLAEDLLDGTAETHKLTYEDILDMVSPF